MFDEGGNVGAEEVLAGAESDNKWCIAAGCQNHIGLVLVNHQDGESSVQAIHDVAERGEEIVGLLIFSSNQVSGNLGVGLRRESGAFGQQLGL